MTPYRLLLVGRETTVPISLEGSRWTVGRDLASDIHLDDPMVSRRHALLYLDAGMLWIRDLEARNPTLVNEEICQEERRLIPGDRITWGATVAEVQTANELRARIVRGKTSTASITETQVRPSGEPPSRDPTLRILESLADSLAPVRSAADASLLTLDLVLRELPVQRGFVARLEAREKLQVLASVDGTGREDPDPVRISRSVLSRLRREQTPVCLSATPDRGPGDRPAAVLLCPLLSRGTLRGLIYLESDDRGSSVSDKERELAACLARILASRLETLELLERLRQENAQLKDGETATFSFLGLTAASREIKEFAESLAKHDCPVTIVGEEGTGKETLARHIHLHGRSARPGHIHPFVVLDASAVTGTNPTDELFGTEEDRGPGTGRLAAAHEGTLCIRNLEELPERAQARLVEVLARREVAVRLMVTSTLGRRALFARRRLRVALASYLGTVVIEVPPLRQRIEDLPLLASYFLDELARDVDQGPARVSPRAIDRLRAHVWPGNVAELRQVLTTAAMLARGKTIFPKQLPRKLTAGRPEADERPTDLPSLEETERRHIEHVLAAVGGNKAVASKVLGIANSTLYQKMKKYGIPG